MTDAAPPASELGYGEALAELEAILEEIEDDSVDVDVLATRVRRAAELLRTCRSRIDSARIEVTRIVADLEPATDTADAPQPDDAADPADGGLGSSGDPAGAEADDEPTGE